MRSSSCKSCSSSLPLRRRWRKCSISVVSVEGISLSVFMARSERQFYRSAATVQISKHTF